MNHALTVTSNYTLTVGNNAGRIIAVALSRTLPPAEVLRAGALNRGVNPFCSTFGWDLTPVRAKKWALLFDGGWNWDDRGFFLVKDGHRWGMREAVAIAEDLGVMKGGVS